MQRREFLATLAGTAVAAGVGARPGFAARKRRVFILDQTAGFHHDSIPTAVATVKALGEKTGQWEVVGEASTADDVAKAITADNLKHVDMVFFANTTGTLGFTPEGHRAYYDWMRNGGSYAGVHSASDTFHGDADYLDMLRGEFLTHKAPLKVRIFNQDPSHPACKALPSDFEIFDEIYQFKNWNRADVHVLLSMHNRPDRDRLNETGDFPVAWTHRYGKGRVFYTSLGHHNEIYQNDLYLAHLTGGMRWALGLAKGDDTPGNPIK